MKAKLARERKAWEAEQQKRRDERLRIIREQQEAKEEKLREMAERMRQEAEERQAEYEKQKALEEQLRLDYKKNQDSILEAARRSLEKVKALQEQLQAQRLAAPPAVRIVISCARPPSIAESQTSSLSTSSQTSSTTSEDVDALLEELRRQNPEWEKRRQEVLRVRYCFRACLPPNHPLYSAVQNVRTVQILRPPNQIFQTRRLPPPNDLFTAPMSACALCIQCITDMLRMWTVLHVVDSLPDVPHVIDILGVSMQGSSSMRTSF